MYIHLMTYGVILNNFFYCEEKILLINWYFQDRVHAIWYLGDFKASCLLFSLDINSQKLFGVH